MHLLKAKDQLGKFRERHPKFLPFLKNVAKNVSEGSVIEVKVTNPDGKGATSNIKLTSDDIKILRDLLG